MILVRDTTATDDIAGIAAAAGILTATGGRTSHAAVIARQLDKVCLVGCAALVVDPDGRHCTIAGETFVKATSSRSMVIPAMCWQEVCRSSWSDRLQRWPNLPRGASQRTWRDRVRTGGGRRALSFPLMSFVDAAKS